ncbi:NAD(P)H-binding protein [Sphingomonas sp. HDW15A]|uniref:NAD-dependent epimerase/dehydratase family protein n=1 Tax=Sphingomonas sp. HDW15A TaxID=2714942 RepID=UPI00140896AA|nr:NAD-dependent epimerase/dehydratase family protein [Sphingomonas sp. HDW15A]QIK97098.1 NAD(P)H-binding protein [Sphingomonas sp. HDW15A]
MTGATGFVGTRLIDQVVASGHSAHALTRREQACREDVTWISGSLEDSGSLDRLCAGADAIVHVAGVINAPDMAGFEAGNVGGTANVVEAAKRNAVRRFVHVSSLAAREPRLSQYGASKARSEHLVRASGLDWVIVRPPAVYGPGDRETLELFRMAKRGLMLMPPEGKLSLIHVDDLARLLVALADPAAPAQMLIEPDDAHPGGYTHRQFASLLASAFGTNAKIFSAPSAVVRAAARLDRLVRGRNAKLTPDRASYFCHPDWVVSPELAAPKSVWSPRIATRVGIRDTARWYEAIGWL